MTKNYKKTVTRLLLSMAMVLISTLGVWAQAINTYTFTNTSSTFSPLSGATSVNCLTSGTATGDDGISANIALPFTFVYGGTSMTNFQINTNGWLALNTGTANTATGTASFSSATATNNNIIAAFCRDLNGNTTDFSYLTTGTAPNRILKVQWLNRASFSATTVPTSGQFQVWLYECSNKIEIRYGTFTTTGRTTTTTVIVGLRGASNAAANERTMTGTGATAWSSPTVNSTTSNNVAVTTTVFPSSGLVYTFTPPAVSAPTISAISATTACVGTTITLTGTNFYTNKSCNLLTIGATTVTIATASATSITFVAVAGFTGSVSVTTPIGVATFGTFTTLATPTAPTASGATINVGGTTTLTASGAGGTYNWYSAITGGTAIQSSTSTTYTTPVLCSTTTYYLAESNGTCESTPRTAVVVTVNPASISPSPSNGLICGTGSVTLSAPAGYSTYAWTGSSGLPGTTNIQTIAVNPTTTTQYTVTLDGACQLTSNVGVLASAVSPNPSVNPSVVCQGTSVALSAGVSAGNFGVSSTPYSFLTPPGGVTNLVTNGVLTVSTVGGGNDDDGWSNIPLGFTYNFFGTNFTTVNAGTNGTMQFGTFNSSTTGGLGQYSGFASFPSASNPANMIAWLANDMRCNNTNCNIRYWTEGLAPTRKFVFQVINEMQYAGTAANTFMNNGEVILYETTGIAEIHLGTCASTDTKYTGLQNAGTIGATAPGRNGFTTTISTPEAWQFIPPASYTLLWNPTTYLSSSTAVSPTFSSLAPSGAYSYMAAVTNPLTGCVVNTTPLNFTVNPVSVTPIVSTPVNICVNTSTTLTVSGTTTGDIINWYDAATGGNLLQSTTSTSYITPNLLVNTSYWVSATNGLCESPRVQINVVNISPAAPVAPVAQSASFLNTATFTIASPVGGINYNWYSVGTGGTALLLNASSFTTPNLCANTTYYVEAYDGTCASTRTATSVTVTGGIVASTPSTGLVCSSGGSVTLNAPSGFTTYAWTGTGLNTNSGQTVISTPSITTQYSVLIDNTCTLNANVGVLPTSSAATPSVSTTDPCFGSSVTLNSGVSASSFGVVSIPYAAATVPATGVTTLVQNGTTTGFVALSGGSLDDGGWSGIPIGFNYNFFGTNFSTISAGTNGLLMFGTVPGYTTSAGDLGQYSFTTTPQVFPNTANPGNVIALMAADQYFGSGTSGSATGSIKYWNDGIAPTRRFIIQYQSVNGCCSGTNPTFTAQAILYETTGLVEVHIFDKNGGAATVGLQDATKTIGACPTGRQNFSALITTPEAWQFIPPASYTFLWAPTTYLSSSTAGSPTATAVPVSATPYSYNVQVTNPTTGCVTTSSALTFTVHAVPSLPSVTTPINICGPHASTLTVTGSFAPTDLTRWYSVATGGTALQSSTSLSYTTPTLSANTSYWVESYNGFCSSNRVQIDVVYTAPATVSIASTNSAANCGAGPFTSSLTASSTNLTYSYTWVASPNLSTTTGAATTASFTTSKTFTVNATDPSGCFTSATTSVIVDNPLDIVLVSPADLSTNMSLMTSIAWSNNATGPTPTSYDVYFGTSSSSPAFIGNQASATYTPGTLQPFTTYYWKIVPKNGACASVVIPTIYEFTTGDFYTMTTGSITTCSGDFYDTGGSTGSYGISESSVLTINPGTPGSKVKLTFNSYDVESGFDYIYIYDGTSTSGTLLATLTGTSSAAVDYTSSDVSGALTVEFSSDNVVNQTGWDATISCLTACTGTPAVSSIPSAVNVCTGKTTTLNVTTAPIYGLTYLWEQSSTGGSFVAATGTNNASSYTTPSSLPATPMYYRCKVICLGGGGTPNFSYSNSCAVSAISCEFNITRTTNIVYSDISSSSTAQHPTWNSTSSDDNYTTPIALPSGFNFTFNGASVSAVRMCTNGWLSLDPANSAFTSLSPDWSTSTFSPFSVIAPLWCDLVAPGNLGTASLTAGIWYDVQGTSPNRVAIFQWKGMERFAFAGPDLNFQVRLYENSVRTSQKIEIIYGTMIGYNGSGQGGSSYSFGSGIKAASVSSTVQTGEIYVLQNVNSNRFTTTAATHNSTPDCNTKYSFTPGNTYVAPAAPTVAPPSNDNPTTPDLLTLNNGPCTDLCGKFASTKTATASGNTVCSASTQANADDDVWYTFTLPSTPTTGSTGVGVNVYGGYGFKARFEIWDASLTSALVCATASAAGNTASGLYTYGSGANQLTSGNSYYVRVYHDAVGFGGTDGQFAICAFENFPPPTNDEPCGAYALTASTGTSCNLVNYTSVSATQSVSTVGPIITVPSATCGFTNDDDVWFTYTASNPTASIFVQGNSTYDPVVELYTATGSCAGGLTLAASSAYAASCNNATGAGGLETINLTGLTSGTKIYVRVYHKLAGFGSGSFGICILSNIPPANDACANATALTFGTSCNPITSTSAYGTLSQATSASCSSSNPDDDVWFTVTRPASSSSMNIVVTGSSNYDAAFEVFTGTCGSLTSLGCTNTSSATSNAVESKLYTGLLAATTTYRIRVYNAAAGFGSGTFSICVYSGVAPANVVPCSAPNASANSGYIAGLPTVLSAYDNGGSVYGGLTNANVANNPPSGPSLVYYTGSTAYAYAYSGSPTPSCGSVATTSKPVWYKFRVPTFSAGLTVRSITAYGQTMTPILAAYILTGNSICNTPIFTPITGGCSSSGTLTLSSTALAPYMVGGAQYSSMVDHYIYVQLQGSSSVPSGNYTISVQGTVTGHTLTNPTTTSLRVNFPSFSNPAPGKYVLYWQKVGSTGANYVNLTPASSYTINGLTSNQSYKVWVKYADISSSTGSQIYAAAVTANTTAGCGGNLGAPSVVQTVGHCKQADVSWISVTSQGVPTNLVPASSTYPYRVLYNYTNVTGFHGFVQALASQPVAGYHVANLPLSQLVNFSYTFKCVGGAVMSSYTQAFTTCAGPARAIAPTHTEYVIGDVHYVDASEEELMAALSANMVDDGEIHEFNLVNIANEGKSEVEAAIAAGTFELIPNPTSSNVTVNYSLPTANATSATVRVMDVQGKVVREEKLSNPSQNGSVKFELSELEAGVYMVNIQSEGYTETKKLVVSK